MLVDHRDGDDDGHRPALRLSPGSERVEVPDVRVAVDADTRAMPSQIHHHNGTPAEWLEDAAFLGLLFAAAAIIATVIVLMIVL